jgi:diguanylate cyclase (GGDEF)-like protein
MKPIRDLGLIDCWSDDRINVGDDWKENISAAITSAQIAVLLVSKDFLSSDFIVKNELAPILKLAVTKKIKIIWIPVTYSTYAFTELASYQAAFDPKVPLESMSKAKRNKHIVDLCSTIVGHAYKTTGQKTTQESILDSFILTPDELRTSHAYNLEIGKKHEDSLTTFQDNKEYGTRFVELELPMIIEKMPYADNYLNSVLFLDIDDLTVINKNFGEKVGDLVIDSIQKIIKNKRSFRYSGRCGDDTFYGVLFGVTEHRTEKFCKELHQDIVAYNWTSIADKLRVSCTIGVAHLQKDESALSWLIRSIEGMLYGKQNKGSFVNEGPLHLNKAKTEKYSLQSQKRKATFSLRDFFS